MIYFLHLIWGIMLSKTPLIWFKGKILTREEANINVLSPTSQYGINVFEGIRCYWNEDRQQLFAFKLEEHLKRLLNSAKLLKLEHNLDLDFIKKAFIKTIHANEFKEDIIVRITLFLDGEGSWSSKKPVSMFISAIPKGRYYKGKEGIRCCVSSWRRIDDTTLPPRVKAGANYLNSRYAQLEAMDSGYDSCILLNKLGMVAEGPGACVFLVRDNKVITPNITSSILESINRKFIIHLITEELKFKVEERQIDRTELYISEEIFFVGTAVEITPIIQIDTFKVNNGKVGKITKSLRNLFFEIVRGNYKLDTYKKFLTPIY